MFMMIPNSIQHLCQTQANTTQHSAQKRPTTLDEHFKQCQTHSNIFAKPKPILPNTVFKRGQLASSAG